MNYQEESLRLHKEWGGKITIESTVPVKTKDDLSIAYTPGVAEPCLAIQEDINQSYVLTRRHNLCAVITDGNAIINGMSDFETADNLASTIRIGALPVKLEEVRSQVVGAKLGQDAIRTSLVAGAIGLALIIIFMIIVSRI